jgi:hypothetical protein
MRLRTFLFLSIQQKPNALRACRAAGYAICLWEEEYENDELGLKMRLGQSKILNAL